MKNIGTPWVNTLAADRHGNALYADVSVVPDVDAAHLQRCAPSKPAAALLPAAGLVVLDGSRSDCDWRKDPASPVPGLIPMERMPTTVRTDWVHNSNDGVFLYHPLQKWSGISPMVGTEALTRPRTRAGLTEIPELLARGKVTPDAAQTQLFSNRNFMASVVVPDLLAACANAPTAEARDGCAPCVAGTSPTTWILVVPICSANSGARCARCPACIAWRLTRRSLPQHRLV
jgi:acyl-homoserine-lactone acylase